MTYFFFQHRFLPVQQYVYLIHDVTTSNKCGCACMHACIAWPYVHAACRAYYAKIIVRKYIYSYNAWIAATV